MKVYFMTRLDNQGEHRLLLQSPHNLRHSTDKRVIEDAIKKTYDPSKFSVLEINLPAEL